jgi:hypothetical protein
MPRNLPAAVALLVRSQRQFIASQLRDGCRLRLDGHFGVSLRNIARRVSLNGIRNAMLNARLNADGLEAMPPRMVGRNVLRGDYGADEFPDPILDAL